MKVLLIEDDAQLAENTALTLKRSGFAVDTAGNAEDGLFQSREFDYDCIVLDINLPDGNGFEICRTLRLEHNTTPIIILTARDSVTDKVRGLDLGADEYVLKPIDGQELAARVRALVRRNSKEPLPLLTIGDLVVDPRSQRVTRGGKAVELPSKEFAVLEYLARHSDEVVTRTMLMEHVWGSDFETMSNVIDVYIRNLRRKIDKDRKPLIHTIRGGGYCLSDKR